MKLISIFTLDSYDDFGRYHPGGAEKFIDESALEIIEVQTGEYLGEDDIIRIEDIYGRADLH